MPPPPSPVAKTNALTEVEMINLDSTRRTLKNRIEDGVRGKKAMFDVRVIHVTLHVNTGQFSSSLPRMET